MTTPRNQSVVKAFAMLEAFARPDEWLTCSELSRRARLPEASGYRLIQTLADIGAVTRGSRGRYRPGLLLVSLSQKVSIGDLLRDAAAPILDALSADLDLTLHVGILEEDMVTYVSKSTTPTSFDPLTRLGAQLEAYCSGLGKVLLAALSEAQLDDFFMDGELIALTPHTVIDPARLRAQLRDVARQGHAVDDREIRAEMRCLAVPIRDAGGRTIAALSASDAADRMTPKWMAALKERLTEAAAAIGRHISPAERSSPIRRPGKRPQSHAARRQAVAGD